MMFSTCPRCNYPLPDTREPHECKNEEENRKAENSRKDVVSDDRPGDKEELEPVNPKSDKLSKGGTFDQLQIWFNDPFVLIV